MGWWDRYKAWEPERAWDRYQTWRVESRTRYAVTTVGMRAPFVFALLFYTGSSASKALLVTAALAVLGILAFGWLWYPKSKVTASSPSAPTLPSNDDRVGNRP